MDRESYQKMSEWLIKELDIATRQATMWRLAEDRAYPAKLDSKIQFLHGYLKAIKNLQDEKLVGEVVKDLKEEFWKKRFYGKIT